MTVNPTQVRPAARRASRKPLVYDLIRRIDAGTLSFADDLLKPHPEYDRWRSRGRMTAEMVARLLLAELGFAAWMADPDAGGDLDPELWTHRAIVQLMTTAERTEDERRLLFELQMLAYEDDPAARQAAFDALRQHSENRKILDKLIGQIDTLRHSRKRVRVGEKTYRVGELAESSDREQQLRAELGERFVTGNDWKYRTAKVRDWRRNIAERDSLDRRDKPSF